LLNPERKAKDLPAKQNQQSIRMQSKRHSRLQEWSMHVTGSLRNRKLPKDHIQSANDSRYLASTTAGAFLVLVKRAFLVF